MNKLLLEVENVSKIHKKKILIDQISIKVHSGEIVGLLGLNGSGKSTFMKMLMGLIEPTQGSILYFDRCFYLYKSTILPRLGCVHEVEAFYEHLTVKENLKLITNIVGVHKPGYMEELLLSFGLSDVSDLKVIFLSLASKKKLALVRALLNQPSLLILDEPFNDLDFKTTKLISDILLRLSREKNMGILISSHILSDIETLADRLILMDKGKVLKKINKDFLKTNEGSYYVLDVDDQTKASELLNQHGYTSFVGDTQKVMIVNKALEVNKVLKLLHENNLNCYEIYPHILSLENYFNHVIKKEMRL